MKETGVKATLMKYIREKSVFIYGTGGCCGEDGALVSDDGRQLLQ